MRRFIQSKLEELTNIQSGGIIPDDIVVENTTYFGYELSKNYINTDLNKNYTYRQNITGYVVRLLDMTENTQQIVDEAVDRVDEELALHRGAEALHVVEDGGHVGNELDHHVIEVSEVPEEGVEGREDESHPDVEQELEDDGEEQKGELPGEGDPVDGDEDEVDRQDE